MRVSEAIENAAARVSRRDAETLLLHVTGHDRAWLLAHPEAVLQEAEVAGFFENIGRRAKHWPLQYLTGRQEFFGLDLQLSRDVLIPRSETELLVEAVLHWASEHAVGTGAWRIVDVGTGSGAIALALAKELATSQLWAVDVSTPVRPVVESNARRNGVAERVRFVESDLLSVFLAQAGGEVGFDVVVSNPPYVPTGDAAGMQPEVRDFEPHLALFAGEDGLAIYRRLIPQAWEVLRAGGLLGMEIGYGQQEALAELLVAWNSVRFAKDYAGIPRIVMAERP